MGYWASTANSDPAAPRAQQLEALLNLLRLERGYSKIAARRYRLALWVLGREGVAPKKST